MFLFRGAYETTLQTIALLDSSGKSLVNFFLNKRMMFTWELNDILRGLPGLNIFPCGRIKLYRYSQGNNNSFCESRGFKSESEATARTPVNSSVADTM